MLLNRTKVFLCYNFRWFARKACVDGQVLSMMVVEEENLACGDGLWPEGTV